VFREFDLSLGQTEEEIRSHYEATCDHLLTYHGVQAIAGASHWQFTAYKKVLSEFLPFQMDRPMGQVKELDLRMNEKGLLRLMPVQPYVMNMSNTLADAAKEKAQSKKAAGRNRLLDMPPVKKTLLGFYNQIFRWYYDDRQK